LHINGFIHRDVKAANLLIDDDGTVLLGDLGVATALNDEDSTSPKSAGIPGSASDVVSPRSTAPLITSGMGKRKSFVGTVGSSYFHPLAEVVTMPTAVLDGSRSHIAKALRFQSGHLEFRYHSA
jgi:serine/threonine protein kinase